jgi:uncharacterized protein YjdB
MGRVLNQSKADIDDVIAIINDLEGISVIDTLDSTSPLAALSANMGRYLDLTKAPRVHTSPSGTTFGRATISLFGHTRAAETDPLMDGTVFRGTDDGRYARGDHRHPTDITRAPLHDAELTGSPKAPSPADNSNDGRIATTEWVRRNAVGVNKGFCTTAGNVALKVVTLKSDFMENVVFLRQTGSSVVVTFTNADVSTGVTQLDVQGTGAAKILYGGLEIVPNMISANNSHMFTFDGTNWRLLNPAALHPLADADNSNRPVSSDWVRKNIPGVLWGTCDTAEATTTKVATLRSTYVTNFVFTRQIGSTVVINFKNGDNSPNVTDLNVQETGAAPIVFEGRPVIPYMIDKDLDHMFTFDGTNWRLLNPSMMGTESFGGFSTGPANQMTEYLGFTVEGHSGTTDSNGQVNKVLVTIPFKSLKPEGATVTISNNIADWAIRMGDSQLINLSDPSILFTSRGHSVVLFTMATYYPSNSPCGLVARRPQASIKIQSDSSDIPYVAITGIDNVPTSMNAGDTQNLSSFQAAPVNATNQTIVWSIVNAGGTGAAINTGKLSVISSGSFTLRATIANGLTPTTPFVKDFVITVNAASISITNQPTSYSEVIYGSITGSLSVIATVVAGTLSYQWYSNTTNSNVGGTAISGATNSTLTIPTNLAGGESYFFCEVRATGGATSVRSNVARVNVIVKATGVTISPKPTSLVEFSSVQLTATVAPSTTTNKSVVWSTSDSSIASIIPTGLLTAKKAGTVTVTATTVDGGFVNSFTLTVTAFVSVADITGVSNLTMVNESLTLSSTVSPSDAYNKTIVWTVVDAKDTDASIASGNILRVITTLLDDALITVRATITDGIQPGIPYIKDFVITVKPDYLPVTNIVLENSTTRAGEPLSLNTTIIPFNATNQTIVWSISNDGGTQSSIVNGVFTAVNDGIAKVKATIINGATKTTNYVKEFTIQITDGLIVVTDVTGVPTSIFAKFKTPSIDVIVEPSNATNRSVDFSIKSAGTTNVTIVEGEEALFAPNTGVLKLGISIYEGAGYGIPFVKDFDITSVDYFPVSDILNLPTWFRVDKGLQLSGTVSPANSSYKTILWSIANDGGTNSAINAAGKLSSSNTGTVKVKAVIQKGIEPYGLEPDDEGYDPDFSIDYEKLFDVTVMPPFVPITNITTNIPSTMRKEDVLTLSSTVVPGTATNKTIVWSVVSGSGTIASGKLTATGEGTLKVRATVIKGASDTTDYTQDYTITVLPKFIPIENIVASIPVSMRADTSTNLSGTVYPINATNKTIVWSIAADNGTNSTINGNVLNVVNQGSGNIKIRATVVNGTSDTSDYFQEFTITILPKFIPITNITDVPQSGEINIPLTLTSTVSPSDATNQTIEWSIEDAGTTGATLSGNQLTATSIGTISVRATIINGLSDNSNYVKDFNIIVAAS